MRSTLALVTPPASEPVSLPDARAWCRLDDDPTTNLTLAQLIAAARSAAEEYLRRSLVTQTWKLTLDASYSRGYDLPEGVYDLPVTALYGSLPNTIDLPRGPVSAITSVTTYDLANASSVYDPSNYRVDASGARLILNSGAVWPGSLRPQGGTEIVYVAGYGTASQVPQPIKTGILIHVASLYEQRGNCEDAMDLPPGSKQLYTPYRIMGDRRG